MILQLQIIIQEVSAWLCGRTARSGRACPAVWALRGDLFAADLGVVCLWLCCWLRVGPQFRTRNKYLSNDSRRHEITNVKVYWQLGARWLETEGASAFPGVHGAVLWGLRAAGGSERAPPGQAPMWLPLGCWLATLKGMSLVENRLLGGCHAACHRKCGDGGEGLCGCRGRKLELLGLRVGRTPGGWREGV